MGTDDANVLLGGDGDDTLRGEGGDDLLDGGAGTDTVDLSTSPAPVRVILAGRSATGDGTDRIEGIENAIGSIFSDQMVGDDGANCLDGLDGNDRIEGAGGDDHLDGGAGIDNVDFGLSKELPGFEKIIELKRRLGETRSAGQVVYSDGMAAVSVFIEPLEAKGGEPARTGLSSMGAIHIYTRTVANHMVTVVGEAPAVSVQRIADAVEYRKP